jgi:predicted O-methyltransferase YrrM
MGMGVGPSTSERGGLTPVLGRLRSLRGWLRRVSTGDARSLTDLEFVSGLGDSAFLLYGIARALKPRVAVEIGSARGKSACYVGRALKENGIGKLYAIDPHTRTDWNDLDSVDTLSVMRGNLRALGVQNQVEIMREFSHEVACRWKLPIDMLFIDGDHSYDGVKSDWDLFSPHMTQFGVVVFHDTIWDLRPDPRYSRADMGVPAFIEDLRMQGYPVITLDMDFGVSMVQPTRGGVALGLPQNAVRDGS